MRFHPLPDAADGLPQTLTERGELVIHARWDLCMDTACHQAVTFELPQGLGQHLLADVANALAEPGEPHFILAIKRVDDE